MRTGRYKLYNSKTSLFSPLKTASPISIVESRFRGWIEIIVKLYNWVNERLNETTVCEKKIEQTLDLKLVFLNLNLIDF